MRWPDVPLSTTACLLVAALLRPALAVFADDAYQVDHHVALLGIPLRDSTFFHRPYAQSRASLIYSLSEKHVLGAVNPKDGAIVWRHQLSAGNNSRGFLRAGAEQDNIVSAVDGQVAAWSASDGRLVWSRSLGDARVEDLEIVEMVGAAGASAAKDALLLYTLDGHAMLQRLDGETGDVKWEYTDKR